MVFGTLRSIVRPLSRTLISRTSTSSLTSFAARTACLKPELRCISGGSQAPWFFPISNYVHSLTDTRFPKRRPTDKPRRKRASVRPPGPLAAVQCVPGAPIVPNRPNEGSVKRRNEKKRMRQRRAFILTVLLSYFSWIVEYYDNQAISHQAEKKKRKALVQEAKRKKVIKRVERKMAAVARERAWTQRLAKLQKLEEEKKKSMA